MNKEMTLAVLFVVCSFGVVGAQAQTNDPNKEVAQADRKVYTDVHLTFIHLQNKYTFDVGVGSRVGYDFTQNLSVEGEVNLFPTNKISQGGKKEQGFLRVKVGKRFDRVGFFAKAGPGFLTLSKGESRLLLDEFGCNGDPGSFSCQEFRTTTSFTGDIGGVFEVYPSKRTFIRFDAGNTILTDSGYHKNFQTSSGFGVRF